MSDKVQKIKEEIEKYAKEEALRSDGSPFYGGRVSMCTKILSFIDSLPEESGCEVKFTTKNEDLEEAASEYVREDFHERSRADFKAGAKWHENKMKKTLQTEYEKGRFDTREEMMKTLIRGEIVKDIHNQLSVKSEPLNDAFRDSKFGDKVKIIIVKEE